VVEKNAIAAAGSDIVGVDGSRRRLARVGDGVPPVRVVDGTEAFRFRVGVPRSISSLSAKDRSEAFHPE